MSSAYKSTAEILLDKTNGKSFIKTKNNNAPSIEQELYGTRVYQETDSDEISVVDAHFKESHVIKFSVCDNEGQDKRPTMY